MDKITLAELEEWQCARRTFTLLDVRRAKVREADAADIADTEWRSPDGLFTWKDEIPRDRPVVVVCAHGHEISQGVAATLRAMGLDHDAAETLAGLPVWMDVAFGVGVIGGLVGSVLLLAHRRLALPVFVASLIGYCVLFVGDVTEGVFAALGASQVVVLTSVVAIAVGLVAHSRALARRRFLA